MRFLNMFMLIFSRTIEDVMVHRPTLNSKSLAKATSPYIHLALRQHVRNKTMKFPRVKTTRKLFTYTGEQQEKLIRMLRTDGTGLVTNEDLNDLLGTNINKNTRNAMAHAMVKRIAGYEGSSMGGTDIGRLSGWWKKSAPTKFKFIKKICTTRKRIVIYSQFRHVAIRLMEYLKAEGFEGRVQDAVTTYPSFNVQTMQQAFFGDRDIIVLHPNMTEGVSIKAASTLIITEPFIEASAKRQLEARVVRLGSHAMVNTNSVEIITCVTGMSNLLNSSDIDGGKGFVGTFVTGVKKVIADQVGTLKLMYRAPKDLVIPPWFYAEGTEHLTIGPEINQEVKLHRLEQIIDSFVQQVSQIIHTNNV